MPTTFNVIFLGNYASLDPTEGGAVSENAASLVGTMAGSSGAPLHENVQAFSPGSAGYGGGDSTVYDTNNSATNDQFQIDGGSDQTFDSAVVYNATVTFVDGTTASVTAVVFQDTAGNTYLAPEISQNADQDSYDSLPIESLTLDSLLNDNANLGGDRDDGNFDVIETVDGTSGNDTITVGYTDSDGDQVGDDWEIIEAGDGDDSVNAGGGDDTIYGGAGQDNIHGGDGDDTIYSGTNDFTYDLVEGGAGADTLFGEGGYAVVGYWSSGGAVYVDLSDGAAESGADAEGDIITGFEQLDGSNYGDTLTGDNSSMQIKGWQGNDTITGGSGNDRLYGGEDNDTLYGLDGMDSLAGGVGNDEMHGDADQDRFILDDTWGTDTVYGGSGGVDDDTIDFTDVGSGGVTVTFTGSESGGATQGGNTVTFTDIEAVEGTDLGDNIDASADSSGLDLFGNGGDDTIIGGSGDDFIAGGADDDLITTGGGYDVIEAGPGTDTVTDFNIADTDLDGFTQDQLDVSGLSGGTGAGGAVTADDVVVTDDGSGNAVLTFPDSEQLVLQGVSPAYASNAANLYSMGIPCFSSGTRIDTPSGPRPVENLRVGDLVQTRYHGPQPVRWASTTTLGPEALTNHPELRPIELRPSALLPLNRRIFVSPQHRIVLSDPLLEGICGSRDVFVRAALLSKYASSGARLARSKRQITYHHLLLDHHEVLTSDGLATESFYPGPRALNGIGTAARQALFNVRPEFSFIVAGTGPAGHDIARTVYGKVALPDLRRHELESFLERCAPLAPLREFELKLAS